jgi:hypothetical protein
MSRLHRIRTFLAHESLRDVLGGVWLAMLMLALMNLPAMVS